MTNSGQSVTGSINFEAFGQTAGSSGSIGDAYNHGFEDRAGRPSLGGPDVELAAYPALYPDLQRHPGA